MADTVEKRAFCELAFCEGGPSLLFLRPKQPKRYSLEILCDGGEMENATHPSQVLRADSLLFEVILRLNQRSTDRTRRL
jgi:hypothetical protein